MQTITLHRCLLTLVFPVQAPTAMGVDRRDEIRHKLEEEAAKRNPNDAEDNWNRQYKSHRPSDSGRTEREWSRTRSLFNEEVAPSQWRRSGGGGKDEVSRRSRRKSGYPSADGQSGSGSRE